MFALILSRISWDLRFAQALFYINIGYSHFSIHNYHL